MIAFTVRRRRSRYYFTVKVFANKRAMWAYHAARMVVIGAKDTGRCDFEAVCMCYERIRARDEKRMPDIGEVLFHRKAVGVGIMTHELLHAALHYERLVNGNRTATLTGSIGSEEERVAHTLTDLTTQFTCQAYQLGIYK